MTTLFKTAEQIAKAYGGKKFKVVRKPSEVWPDRFEASDELYFLKEYILPSNPIAYQKGSKSLAATDFWVNLSVDKRNRPCMYVIPLDCFDLRAYTNDF